MIRAHDMLQESNAQSPLPISQSTVNAASTPFPSLSSLPGPSSFAGSIASTPALHHSAAHGFGFSYFPTNIVSGAATSGSLSASVPAHLPALARLAESMSSEIGVSPQNIYPQPSSSQTVQDEESERDDNVADGASSSSTSVAAPAPVLGDGEVYAAVYSGVQVYEMFSNDVAVMRRKSDGYMNATQILKVAGIDKGRRTKILDRDIMIGEHQKIQGGYGKYQGTWVPFERGVEIAHEYGVAERLRPLLEFEMPSPGDWDNTPTKEQVLQIHRDAIRRTNSSSSLGRAKVRAPSTDTPESTARKRKPRAIKKVAEVEEPDLMDEDTSDVPSPAGGPDLKKRRTQETYIDTYESTDDKYRAMLMAMFVHEDPFHIPDILSGPTLPPDMDLDLIIDEQGHTSLHWAAALARLNVVRVLLQKGADIRSVNNDGETALIRAVRVTNNYDTQTFPDLLGLLHPTLMLVDDKQRTVLHHIVATAGLEGRVAASRYYTECLLEWVARHGGGNFSALVDLQDSAGDTALNIAARIGNRNLIEQLMDVGADDTIENKAGLKPIDFGFEDLFGRKNGRGVRERSARSEGTSRVVFPSIRTEEEDAALALSAVANAAKGREIPTAVQQMVEEMSSTFSAEMKVKAEQLTEARNQLREVTRELAEVRKQNEKLRKDSEMLPEMVQRIKNLEKCLVEEMARKSMLNGSAPAAEAAGPAAAHVGSEQDLATLRRTLNEKETMERNLRTEIIRLKSTSGKSELGCKKIIAACCSIPLENVDEILAPLLQALESDREVDMSAVARFMSEVKTRDARRA